MEMKKKARISAHIVKYKDGFFNIFIFISIVGKYMRYMEIKFILFYFIFFSFNALITLV